MTTITTLTFDEAWDGVTRASLDEIRDLDTPEGWHREEFEREYALQFDHKRVLEKHFAPLGPDGEPTRPWRWKTHVHHSIFGYSPKNPDTKWVRVTTDQEFAKTIWWESEEALTELGVAA